MPPLHHDRFVLRPGLWVDLARAQLVHDDEAPTPLTAREVSLLRYLHARLGEDVSFDALHAEVWGHAPHVVSRAGQNTVHRLRRKVELDPVRPEHLLTVHGGAVRLVCSAQVAATAGPAGGELLGRAEVVATVRERLIPGSVVTVTGLGGIGKTTVARAVQQAEGALWAELAPAQDRQGVDEAVAAALGIRLVDDQQLARSLEGRGAVLLVLDNAEQVVDDVAHRLRAWREAAPAIRWLVTSRIRLGVAGEQVLVLPPLSLPSGTDESLRSPAVQLYLRRAAPHVGADQAAQVSGLVRALEGIPLAIELAAARAAFLGPEQLTRRLEDGLSLLRRGGGGRHDTLEAAIGWSWSLLSPDAQEALARCAMFRTPFRLEAAEALLDPLETFPLDALQELVDASLLSRDGERLRMAELVRAYAQRQRPPDDQWARAHAEVFALHGAEDVEPLSWLYGPAEWAASAARDQEIADVEAAARWALDHHDPLLGPLVSALVAIRSRRGPIQQPAAAVAVALASERVSERVRGRLRRQWAVSLLLAEEPSASRDVLGPPPETPDPHDALVRQVVHYHLGDNAEAEQAFRLGLGGATSQAPFHLATGGFLALRQQRNDVASARFERSRSLAAPGSHAEVMALSGLAALARNAGRPDQEMALRREVIASARSGRDLSLLADALEALSTASSARGDAEGAEANLAEAIQLRRQLGALPITATLHRTENALRRGRWAEAELLAEEAKQLSARAGFELMQAAASSRLGRALLGSHRLDEAKRVLTEAVAGLGPLPGPLAHSHLYLAVAEARSERPEEAEARLKGLAAPRLQDAPLWDWAQAELALSRGDPSLAVARAQQIAAATDEHAMVRPWLQDLLERAQRGP